MLVRKVTLVYISEEGESVEYGGGVHRIRLCVLESNPGYSKSLSYFYSLYFRYQVCGVWDWSCH